MKEEEQTLLWQALETVPETYRETLVLYYREQRSVEHVANELDLSEDAVKQRLSRGRKLLQEKMMTSWKMPWRTKRSRPCFHRRRCWLHWQPWRRRQRPLAPV